MSRITGRWLPWGVSLLAFVLVTWILFVQRERLDRAHVVLVYLLVILPGSAWGGRILGVFLSGAAFLAFDWFFLPPYQTLVVNDPLDWLVLVAFLITSLVAAQLLHKAKAEQAAREHAKALREVDRLKDALLASVSHDLRTPLTAIKGVAQELREARDGMSIYERAVLIEEQADRLNRLVTNLLDTARLDAGSIPLDIGVNAGEDVLGALGSQFEGRPDRHRIKLRVEGTDILLGRFDFVQTLRVLTNLVENALKYAPIDTVVDVSVQGRAGWLVFEVSDRGPGIPAHLHDRLFEPFTRAESDRPDTGSVGLGLSIARRLVEIQEGTIAYHPRPGGGTTFVCEFPQVV